MARTKYYLFVSILLNFHISLGQESPIKESLNKITQNHFQDSQNRGLALGIIDKDSIQSFYFGGKYTNIIKDVGPNTLFEIGSVTKLFTVHIFNELEKLEIISRTDLLSKYLPEEIYNGKKWANQIRLVDIVTHT